MTRAHLFNRREARRSEIEHDGVKLLVTTGHYRDGKVGEVFIHVHGQTAKGSTLEWMARDAAILVSIALQYGAPVEVLKNAITRDDKGGAATLVGAVLDFIVGEKDDRR